MLSVVVVVEPMAGVGGLISRGRIVCHSESPSTLARNTWNARRTTPLRLLGPGAKKCSKGIVDNGLSVLNVIELMIESMRSKRLVEQSIMSSCFSYYFFFLKDVSVQNSRRK